MASPDTDPRKTLARLWFERLRDDLCAALERLEDKLPGEAPAGRFDRQQWRREGGGGGVMSMMHGRLFEKAGVHCSTVHGQFSPEFARQIPGADASSGDFWASGILWIAHPWEPHAP